MPNVPQHKIMKISFCLALWMYFMVKIANSSLFCDKTLHIQHFIWKQGHDLQRESAILGILERSNYFGPSNKCIFLKS